jgi:hypothetical protein
MNVNSKVVLHTASQKFNTFNTFNIFNTFDPGASRRRSE